MLRKYARNKAGQPRGLVVILPNHEHKTFTLGYSLCSKQDVWDRQRAREIAEGRAEVGVHLDELPQSLFNLGVAMVDRATSYYKDYDYLS